MEVDRSSSGNSAVQSPYVSPWSGVSDHDGQAPLGAPPQDLTASPPGAPALPLQGRRSAAPMPPRGSVPLTGMPVQLQFQKPGGGTGSGIVNVESCATPLDEASNLLIQHAWGRLMDGSSTLDRA